MCQTSVNNRAHAQNRGEGSIWAIFLSLLILLGSATAAFAQKRADDRQEIIATMTSLFSALHDENYAQLKNITVPGFYIFDNGARLDADSVLAFMKGVHAKGTSIVWSITEADVHIVDRDAWITYVNKGSITTGGATKAQTWLESANLHKNSDGWKIEFVHSTRSPETTSSGTSALPH